MRKLLLVAVIAAIVLATTSNLSAHTQATHTWVPYADDDLNQRDRIALWGTSTVYVSKTAAGGDFYNVHWDGFDTITVDNYYAWTSGGDTGIVQGSRMTSWALSANAIRNSAADDEIYAFAPSGLGTITLTKSLDILAVDVGDNSYTHGALGAGYYAVATSHNTVESELGEFNSSGFSAGVENGTRGEAIPFVSALASGIGRIGADDTAGSGPPDIPGNPTARSGSASGRDHNLWC